MNFTDTHTHLYSEEFNTDIDDVILRSVNIGVSRFFLPNIDSASIVPMLNLCDKYPLNCFPMMGLHPCSVKENYKEELKIAESWFSRKKFYAVGEIGIDLYWDKTYAEEQKQAFITQIEWAKMFKLPIVIHTRNSFEETIEIVEKFNDENLKGIFHCFSGSLDDADRIIALGGFKLGIGGVVTFKKAGLDEIVKQIELKHLVLETDSPYLAPVPYRGKRNESSYIVEIAVKMAELHNASIEEIAQITTKNTKEIFGI